MAKSAKTEAAIGVLGGSGVYQIDGLTKVREIKVSTPFGAPSDAFIEGYLEEKRILFLPRHGRGHYLTPTEVNARANIFAMKKLGVTRIISFAAVGSLKESISPGDFVVVDQFLDRAQSRPSTFFGRGVVGHVVFADPVCPELAALLAKKSQEIGVKTHHGGTYVCIEGPHFSTRVESRLYRQWGADVIGMTNLQEAKLAREAEICFSTVAMVTDYDCWREDHQDVSVELVLKVMAVNTRKAKKLLTQAIPKIAFNGACSCSSALKNAIMTDHQKIPARVLKELKPILGKYFP